MAAVIIGLLVLGCWVTARAWVSVEGDDPHCFPCGYNLTGCAKPWDACPECGADLSESKNVARGARAFRRGWFLAGLSLFLVAALWEPLNRFYHGYDWTKLKTTPALIDSVDQGFRFTRSNRGAYSYSAEGTPEERELIRRLETDGLSEEHLEAIRAVALPVDEDRTSAHQMNQRWVKIVEFPGIAAPPNASALA